MEYKKYNKTETDTHIENKLVVTNGEGERERERGRGKIGIEN